jgi:hypothetical protein
MMLTVSNDGHVTDVSPSVHQSTDLLNGEAVETWLAG